MTDPNIQNIPIHTPEGMAIKEALTPKPIDTDYSKIEQRILASMSDWVPFKDDWKTPCPVDAETEVIVQLSDGGLLFGEAGSFYWNIGPCAVDIVAYRVMS